MKPGNPTHRFAVLYLVCAVTCIASELDGTWRGTFHGQPTHLLPDGTYPETVTGFELRLSEARDGCIVGEFRVINGGKNTPQPIRNGKRFDESRLF